MSNSKVYFVVSLLLLFYSVAAQNDKEAAVVSFHLKWQNETLALGKNYTSCKDTLQFSALKFYLSGFEIYYDDATVFKPTDEPHLIDLKNGDTFNFPVGYNKNKKVSKVLFCIGIDSLKSISGALGGDLDPSNGMYWAWQSGYINLKMEGKSNSCKTRKNAFQFHVGGYLNPYCARRKIALYPTNEALNICVDFSKIFEDLSLSKVNSIMIPSKNAMEIADLSVNLFSIE